MNITFIAVTPIPGYPIIEGCNQEQYCVLEVDTKGRLTCTVRGIRPEVKLEWRVFHEESKELLIFHGQQVHTRSNGDTMDVTLATEFTAKEIAEKRLTLECTAVGPSATYFDLSSKVDLLFSGSGMNLLASLVLSFFVSTFGLNLFLHVALSPYERR